MFESCLSMTKETTNTRSIDDANVGLLPIGLEDQLPPDAEREAAVLENIMRMLGEEGFDRVKPPLLEFEQTLLATAPAKLRRRSFRVVDPLSRETLVLRSDMTGQVARMAATRLSAVSRPLRLSYGGQVVRVSGSDLRPERQFTQVGAEIIGLADHEKVAAVVEVASLALKGIARAGIGHTVVDLVVPGLVERICQTYQHDLDDDLLAAIAARDPQMVAAHACGKCVEELEALMTAAGPWRDSLRRLESLMGQADIELITQVAQTIEARHPGVEITLDPAETRGFDYHEGIGFVFFAPSVRGELGRGGAYTAENTETGAGFTLYLDSLVRALGPQTPAEYVFLPSSMAGDLDRILTSGRRVRHQLGSATDDAELSQEAKRMNCVSIWDGNQAVKL